MADQIILGMGLKTTNFEKSLNDASNLVGHVSGQIAKKFEMKDLGRTMATALGLNVEVMGEKVARFFANMSEEQEKFFKESDELNAKSLATFERRLALRRGESQMLDEQKKLEKELQGIYDAADRKALASQEVIATINAKAKQDKVREQYLEEKQVDMARIKGALEDLALIQQQKEIDAKKRILDLDQEDFMRITKQLDVRLQVGLLQDRAAQQEKEIANFKGMGAELDIKKLELAKTSKELKDATFEVEKAEAALIEAHQAERLKFAEENERMLLLEAKQRHGLTEEEGKELKVLQDKLQIKKNNVEIDRILATPLVDRTSQEKDRLDFLTKQNATLLAQVAILTQGVLPVNQQINEELGFAVNQLKSYVAEWEGFEMKVTNKGRGDNQLSDRELQRKIDALQSDVTQRQINAFNAPGDFAGSGYDAMLPFQQITLQQAREEMAFRQNVRSTAAQLGNDAAFSQFNGLTEQRFAEILQTATDNSTQTSLLRDIKQGILDQKTAADDSMISSQLTKLTAATQAVAIVLNSRVVPTGG